MSQDQSQSMPWRLVFGFACSVSSFTSFASTCCCGINASRLQWSSSTLRLCSIWAHESYTSQCRVLKYSSRLRYTISLWFHPSRPSLSVWVTVRILSSSSLISQSSIVRRIRSTRGSSARSEFISTACWLSGSSSSAATSFLPSAMSRKVRLGNSSSSPCWASNYS